LCVSNFGELPKYLGIFDVCLIPFEVDEFTKKIYPKKFHQYMAAGKPVVSSRLPELEPFAPRVEFYSDIKEIEVKIKKLLSEDAEEKVLERRKIASENTWDRRVESMIQIFNTILKERMPSS
jgi:glycosyltransferase involved in cell wall biosynthesis